MSAPTLSPYDRIIVAFSGGKDSLACLLHIIDLGVPRHRIELWHHDIDGREGSTLMDWPCTRDYCRQVAEAFEVPIFFSWKAGGFEGELRRKSRPTMPTRFEVEHGPEVARSELGRADRPWKEVGGQGPVGTRGKFPQTTADLRVRWCSAYLKIDIARRALSNSHRLNHSSTLFITGERAQESPGRAKYAEFERHPADARDGKKRRLIDWWRPVHAWSENAVWAKIKHHRVRPHPAYFLGWGRVSCAACIFGSPAQWASLRRVNPEQFRRVAQLERASGQTIQRTKSIVELADAGTVYPGIKDEDIADALSTGFTRPVIVGPGAWVLPAGAFGDGAGPT